MEPRAWFTRSILVTILVVSLVGLFDLDLLPGESGWQLLSEAYMLCSTSLLLLNRRRIALLDTVAWFMLGSAAAWSSVLFAEEFGSRVVVLWAGVAIAAFGEGVLAARGVYATAGGVQRIQRPSK